jgi:hypothetical protein
VDIEDLSEDEKKVLGIIGKMEEDGDYVVEGGGVLFSWGNTDNLPVTVEALNIKGNYVEWFYCETVKEAKRDLLEQKTQLLEMGKSFPKTRIKFHGIVVE